MKRTLLILVSLVVIIFVVNCNSGPAISYNDRIVNYQGKIIEKMLDFSNALAKADPTDMNAKLNVLQLQIDESLAGISKMEDFKGNFRLRDGAIALFEFYQSIAANEYPEIINILSMGAENISEYDRDRLMEIQKDITKREIEFDNELQAAQREFAQVYGIDIKRNEYQDKIDKMGK